MVEGKEEVKQEDFDEFVEKILNYKSKNGKKSSNKAEENFQHQGKVNNGSTKKGS